MIDSRATLPGSLFAPAITRVVIVVGAVVAVAVGSALGAIVHPVIGFAALFGVLAAIGIVAHPMLGLVAFVATVTLLPFAVIPVPIGGVKLTFVDAILALLLFLWVARLLARAEDTFRTTALDGPVLVFIGLALVSFILGVQSTPAELTRFFLKSINGILFFFTASNMLTDHRKLRLLAQSLILGAVGASAIAIVFYFLDQALVGRILLSLRAIGYYPSGGELTRTIVESGQLRAIGTSVDPNVLAGTLLLTAPYCATQLFARDPVFRRAWLLPAMAVIVFALVLTFSRSSWVGAVAIALLLATLRYRRLWLIGALVAALLLTLPAGDIILDRVQSGLQFQDRAAQMRLGEYNDALRLIQAYPWFGVGFGASPDIELYVAASSIYLLIAEQMGLIGLSAFFVVVGVFFVVATRAWRRSTDAALETILLSAIAAVTGALVAGVFDHYFFNLYFPQTIALMWLNLGVALATARLINERHDSGPAVASSDQPPVATS